MTWRPDYVSSAELKSYVRISDSVDDAQVEFATSSASRAVDDHTRRQFGQVAAPENRLYVGRFHQKRQEWYVDFDDLQDVAGLSVTVDAGTVTAYRLEPVNAIAEGRPYERLFVERGAIVQPVAGEGHVSVLAKWGWTAVPTAVKQATLLQANRFLNRRTSPYGIAGSPDEGSQLRLLARVDPDVAMSLKDYRRWGRVG